jgi:hypothetical protein
VKQEYWIALGAAAALVGVGLLGWGLGWFRRRGPLLGRALQDIAIDRIQDVLVPDGMGGQIQIEHLVLTASGLVVVDVKEFEGTIFAGDRMAEWTVIGKQGRYTFPNPLGTLYDRVAALRQLVRDLPVGGHVLFAPGADFSKGRPKDVLLPAELLAQYPKLDQAEAERLRTAFAPQWDQLKTTLEPATTGRR